MTLEEQIRAQYGRDGTGSGAWDDAGYDRAKELADLLRLAGITQWGDLAIQDVTRQEMGTQRYDPGQYIQNVNDSGGISYTDLQGNPLQGTVDTDSGAFYQQIMKDVIEQQLRIGDKTVGYLGDYNNDGTYGSKASDYLGGRDTENLLAWSARGDGNTGYHIITDPVTGKLVVAPSWGSSSDASKFREAAIAAAAMAAAGYGIASLGGALGGTTGAGGLGGAGTAATTESLLAGAGLAPELGYGFSTGAGFGGGIGAEYGLLAGLGADSAAAGLVGVGSPLTMAPGSGLYGSQAIGGLGSLAGDPTKAALYGPEGYGPGMSGGQTGAYDAVIGATGNPSLAVGASDLVGALPEGAQSAIGNATSGLGGAGSLIPEGVSSLIPGNAPDWLKLLIPALGGYAAYQDAKKPQLQGYGGSIGGKTAKQTISQGKYGPISNVTYAAAGGMMPSQSGIASQAGPRYLNNAHDGMADGIAAHIDGKQPAALSGGEFVIPADVVSHFGNGNSNAGAKQLYAMMERIRQARTGSPQQGKEIDPTKFMPV